MAASEKKSAKKRAGSRSTAGKKKAPKKPAARSSKAAQKEDGYSAGSSAWSIGSLADRVTDLIEQIAAGTLRSVVDTGGREIASHLPHANELRLEAGAYLRELREVAGLTLGELADAVELSDRSLLEAVEKGTATLSFELTIRLAAVLARHDPLPFVSKLLRSYNPVLWQLLEDWGVSRLPLQLEREREFVNLLRGHDGARELSDADFAQVLAFTKSALETALHFAQERGEDE